jgi:hypothetical protein
MAKPTSFRGTAGASAFRMGAGHVPWRNTDRFRGQSGADTFRKGTTGGKKSGKGGGELMFAPPPRPDFAATPRPAFGRAAQHLPPHATPHRARAEARYRRAARTAAELLPELPHRAMPSTP